MENNVQNIDIDQLRPHPINSKIYQVGDIDELAKEIQQSDWIKPLTVTPRDGAFLIVSGHRRHQAGLLLALDVMPCEVEEFTEDWQVLERLLLENQYREKGNETRLREYPYKKEVAAARARLRQLAAQNNNAVKENFPEQEKGQSRDEAAKEVGIGSGKTAETGIKVIARADELREAGQYEKADLLIAAVNKSVSGAANLLSVVDDLSEDKAAVYEDEIVRGNTTVSGVLAIVKQTKKEIVKDEKNDFKINTKQGVNLIEEIRKVARDKNMFYVSPFKSDARYGDKTMSLNDPIYYTVTTLERFFHRETGIEFSLREYADVQTFPSNYKFIGTHAAIKKQIGNAVAPEMGEYISKKLTGKTCGDLFAGAGGFSCGLHNNGIETKWAVEWDELAAKAFKLNNPTTKVYNSNIVELNPSDFEEVDIIIGGPPCQGVSQAGSDTRSTAVRFKEDPRNQLYKEFIRFVDALKPQEFIMENVWQMAEFKDEIIENFNNVGYDVKVELIKGNDIGMRQNRKRVFFIGKKID